MPKKDKIEIVMSPVVREEAVIFTVSPPGGRFFKMRLPSGVIGSRGAYAASKVWTAAKAALDAYYGEFRRRRLIPGMTVCVKCDAETNPPDVVESGTVIARIEYIRVRPRARRRGCPRR